MYSYLLSKSSVFVFTRELFLLFLVFFLFFLTNEANLMSGFLIYSDNGIGQNQRISGDIWLKGKLQSMFSLAVFDSEGISCVKVSALLP